MNRVKKWGVTGIAVAGVLAVCGGVASATVLASAPEPGNYTLYGCVSGSSRTLEHVYTSGRNFRGCPSGSFAVAFNSTGPAGARGPGGPRGPVGPPGASAPRWRAEVDNGAEFSLSDGASVADTSSTTATYSDAGVVADVGTVGKLATEDTAYKGSASGGTLAENIWIGAGPQASTPGIYPLSSVDFCYGLGQDYSASGVPASFYMTGSNCTGTDGTDYTAQTLTLKQIASDFPATAEAYEWLGVTNGSTTVSATIASVAGQPVNVKVGVTKETSGVLFSFVSG
jgi:hypothetical protein